MFFPQCYHYDLFEESLDTKSDGHVIPAHWDAVDFRKAESDLNKFVSLGGKKCFAVRYMLLSSSVGITHV